MLAGLSTRRYGAGLEPVGEHVEQEATGTSKSAVSRRFVAATAERLAELLGRRLDGRRWLVVYLDGFGMGEHLLIGALGVTADGAKVPLGVVEGSTENAAVATRLVADLAEWMAVRRWTMRSAACSAQGRSSSAAAATRNATSPSTCPRPSARCCCVACGPPGHC